MRLKKLINSYKSDLNDLEYDLKDFKTEKNINPLEIEAFIENLYEIKDIREAIDSLLTEEYKENVEELDLKLSKILEELKLLQDKKTREILKKSFTNIFQKFLPKPATL